MTRPGFFPTTGKVSKITTSAGSTKVSFCLTSTCCEYIPRTLNALVWLEEGTSGGTVYLECELITLVETFTGSGIWQGNLTAGVWNGCLDPNDLLIEFSCDSEGPVSDKEDCLQVFGGLVDPDPVAASVTINEQECCCEPVDGPTCFVGGFGVWSGARVDPSVGCSNGTWANENDGSFGIWIYDTDEYGGVCCDPTPCPAEPPCPVSTPCGEAPAGAPLTMPEDLEVFF